MPTIGPIKRRDLIRYAVFQLRDAISTNLLIHLILAWLNCDSNLRSLVKYTF